MLSLILQYAMFISNDLAYLNPSMVVRLYILISTYIRFLPRVLRGLDISPRVDRFRKSKRNRSVLQSSGFYCAMIPSPVRHKFSMVKTIKLKSTVPRKISKRRSVGKMAKRAREVERSVEDERGYQRRGSNAGWEGGMMRATPLSEDLWNLEPSPLLKDPWDLEPTPLQEDLWNLEPTPLPERFPIAQPLRKSRGIPLHLTPQPTAHSTWENSLQKRQAPRNVPNDTETNFLLQSLEELNSVVDEDFVFFMSLTAPAGREQQNVGKLMRGSLDNTPHPAPPEAGGPTIHSPYVIMPWCIHHPVLLLNMTEKSWDRKVFVQIPCIIPIVTHHRGSYHHLTETSSSIPHTIGRPQTLSPHHFIGKAKCSTNIYKKHIINHELRMTFRIVISGVPC